VVHETATALLYVEAGTLTGQVEGAVTVTRAEAMAAVAVAEDAVLPQTQAIAAGAGFQLDVGDSALYPPGAAGAVSNTGSEPVVVLISVVEPRTDQATPRAMG